MEAVFSKIQTCLQVSTELYGLLLLSLPLTIVVAKVIVLFCGLDFVLFCHPQTENELYDNLAAVLPHRAVLTVGTG